MKKFILIGITFLTITAHATVTNNKFGNCPQALPTTHEKFCTSFETAAECYCHDYGLPKFMCRNMSKIYKRMIMLYGTVENACAAQKDVPPQTCIDDWKCYRFGGSDSLGGLCRGNGQMCHEIDT